MRLHRRGCPPPPGRVVTATEHAPIESADDLRARIRELGADEADPAVVTDRILRSLTAGEFRVVAAAALHEFVRHALTHSRGVEQPAQQTYETASGRRTVSRKVAAFHDWVERELRDRVCVDEAARQWKFLADCTAADLYATAAMRRRKAAATLAEAERHEDIAKAVEHAGVDTVSALPRSALEAVLRR